MDLDDLQPDQQKAVLALIQTTSVAQAAKASKISVAKLWGLLKEEKFKKILKTHRNEVFREALDGIKCSTTRAVNVLTALLDSEDEKIRRSAANDIIDKAIKAQELIELEERIKTIEGMVCEQQKD